MTRQRSSYSAGNGACVERWRKSSYSADTANCVEVDQCWCRGVPVRDSKNPDGPVLVFPKSTWTEFLAGVKQGQFDI